MDLMISVCFSFFIFIFIFYFSSLGARRENFTNRGNGHFKFGRILKKF